jgi:hypothetical protein
VRIRRAFGVLALGAGVALAAGCTGRGDDGTANLPSAPDSASASAAASAAVQAGGDLRTAVRELTANSYRYTLKAGDTSGSGAVDPVAKAADLTLAVAAEFSIQARVIGTDYYAKITGLDMPGVDGRRWLHIDATKVKSLASLGIADVNDPSGVGAAAGTIATIEKTGDRSYRGTLDLTKGAAGLGMDEVAVRQLGPQARSVPFEATLNEQGRVATWKITIPAYGSQKQTVYEVTYTDHGARSDVRRPPAGEISEAPDAVYQMLQV